MDPDTRADYDSLVGFSKLAKNPFTDTAIERDQVLIQRLHYAASGQILEANSNSVPHWQSAKLLAYTYS